MLPALWLVGWLPAFAAGWAAAGSARAGVLSDAGRPGWLAGAGLAVSLAILGVAYVRAIRMPPSPRALVAAALFGLIGASTLPVRFSADADAYAYYGDLLRHGHNPWSHAAPPVSDPIAAAALTAWDGRLPPRCVYGPLAVALAALGDAAGGDGVAGQRLLGLLAYAGFVWAGLRCFADPRARALLLLNPVLLWSAAEGHNDVIMAALVLAAFAVQGVRREALLWAAVWVKAPAVLAAGALRRRGERLLFAVLAVAAYVPLGASWAADPQRAAAPQGVVWLSPLGSVQAVAGTAVAVAAGAAIAAAAAWALRGLEGGERSVALAGIGWLLLPNAYPWYGFWIVPMAARRPQSAWSYVVVIESLVAAARAIADAIGASDGMMLGLIALVPLAALLRAAGRRPAVPAIAAVLAVLCVGRLALAQSQTPAPIPAAPGQPTAVPAPPSPASSLPPVLPAPSGTPSPAATGSPAATPTPAPASPAPAPSSPAPQASSSALPVTPAPIPPHATAAPMAVPTAAPPANATPNPFLYVITPTPVPVTSPDGPHIVQVLLNDRRIRAGGPLVVEVLTSPNVVGVEARALGRFIPIPRSTPGLFALSYTMPGSIPFWLLNKNYDIVIAAATADGRQTSVSFPMLLTR